MLPAYDPDRARFEALFEQHHRAVLAYLLRRTRCEADAEDLAAETFAVAWRRRADTPSEPRPWLFAVARRLVANHHRGAGRWARLLERLRSHQDQGAPAPLPSGAGLALDALTALSKDDQELLKLVAWEALSHGEIAASLGITTNAVGIRIHRARHRYTQAYAALAGTTTRGGSGAMKGFGASRTSLPVTGSSTASWRHEDA